MKCRSLTQLRSLVAVLAFSLAGRGYAQTSAYELCIEQSPAQAGRLTPDSGTHRFAPDAVVVLSAEPRPGYHFAYWLGDVADPKAQRTTVQVNSPKVVVAVFQTTRHDYPQEVLTDVGGGSGGGGGGGKAVATAVDLSVPGWSIASGGTKAQSAVASKPMPVPVPEPVPEPTTVALLGLGLIALRRTLR